MCPHCVQSDLRWVLEQLAVSSWATNKPPTGWKQPNVDENEGKVEIPIFWSAIKCVAIASCPFWMLLFKRQSWFEAKQSSEWTLRFRLCWKAQDANWASSSWFPWSNSARAVFGSSLFVQSHLSHEWMHRANASSPPCSNLWSDGAIEKLPEMSISSLVFRSLLPLQWF